MGAPKPPCSIRYCAIRTFIVRFNESLPLPNFSFLESESCFVDRSAFMDIRPKQLLRPPVPDRGFAERAAIVSINVASIAGLPPCQIQRDQDGQHPNAGNVKPNCRAVVDVGTGGCSPGLIG